MYMRHEYHISEPVSGPTGIGLIGKGVYDVGRNGVQQWYDPNGYKRPNPP